MARGKPGDWQTFPARALDRVTRNRMADEMIRELRGMKRPPDEDRSVEIARSTADTLMVGRLSHDGEIRIRDCLIRRERRIRPADA